MNNKRRGNYMKTCWVPLAVAVFHPNRSEVSPHKCIQSLSVLRGRQRGRAGVHYGHKFHGYRVSYPGMIAPSMGATSHLAKLPWGSWTVYAWYTTTLLSSDGFPTAFFISVRSNKSCPEIIDGLLFLKCIFGLMLFAKWCNSCVCAPVWNPNSLLKRSALIMQWLHSPSTTCEHPNYHEFVIFLYSTIWNLHSHVIYSTSKHKYSL